MSIFGVMTAAEDEDNQLKRELLMADLQLRRKQVVWETPRNIGILAAAIAAIAGVLFGTLGYKIGQQPAPPPVIINLPPAAPAK
jgi:hypothetical protein